MAIDSEARTSRRGILAAALGGAGALLASRLGRPESARAADNGNALLGNANLSNTPTTFENQDAGETSLGAIQTSGVAIQATASTGTGVRADSTDNTPSDFTAVSYRSGVVGTAGAIGNPGDELAIAATSDETGVYGYSNISDASFGVWGDSWTGTGVFGTGAWGVYGVGYDGVSGVGSHFGLYGGVQNATAYALFTDGKIRFNGRSGRTYITSGHYYKDVVVTGMTTSSWVLVTLQTYKSGYVVAAAVSYAGKFRLYLNKSATSTIYFSYLVMN